MNDHKEHISQYSAAAIQRYVQGKLSAREMHAMEKAALDDPFLADAIEGMQQALTDHDESLVTAQLRQLQQQFETRTAGAGNVVAFKPFRYWQAAAAVVVIISGVWIYTLVNNSSQKNQAVLAKTEEPTPSQQQAAPVLSDSPEKALSTDSTPAQRTIVNATTSKYYITIKKNKKEAAAATAPGTAAAPAFTTSSLPLQKADSAKQGIDNNRSDIAADKDVAAEKKEAASMPAAPVSETLARVRKTDDAKTQERERETELITIAKNDSPKKTFDFKSNGNKNLSGVIKGQVTDQNNNPIANAYLQIPKNNNNFITDKSGFFKIPVTDSVVDVAVNVTGYGTQNFRLQNNAAMNQLQLQPANIALDEVIVTSAKAKKGVAGRSKLPSEMVHDAEPVMGWVAFDQYLEKNKRAISGPINAGQVVVSFQVNKKGTLSDFKIEQSLSKTYDDEAIRLIMQGPAWKLLKGRKARITVMVRF